MLFCTIIYIFVTWKTLQLLVFSRGSLAHKILHLKSPFLFGEGFFFVYIVSFFYLLSVQHFNHFSKSSKLSYVFLHEPFFPEIDMSCHFLLPTSNVQNAPTRRSIPFFGLHLSVPYACLWTVGLTWHVN